MSYLSEKEIILKIENRELFKATIESGAFTVKIDSYEPAFSTAIHNGDRLSQELVDNCLLSQKERYQEEDPYTGSFIDRQAITIINHDSRYEYDLNRKPEDCVYETAWGKKVWEKQLNKAEDLASRKKHAQFYRILHTLIEALRKDFGQCIVYDIHSYNYKRYERKDLPVFNIGTSSIKNDGWRPIIIAWLAALQKCKIDPVPITVAENDIFLGKGYLAMSCHERYDNVLVLATEVKKVFMDELTGEPDVQVLSSLQKEFNNAISSHSKLFCK